MTEINEQLIFNLNRRGNAGLENFYISESNEIAVSAVKNWHQWPAKKLLLIGPVGSGKSHLADFWVKKAQAQTVSIDEICQCNVLDLIEAKALMIDNIHTIVQYCDGVKLAIEEKLFHLLNSMVRTSSYLMITSSTPIAAWNLSLPDLTSRLSTIAIGELFQPDDELLVAVLLKQFDDKQIKVSPEFILFVARRINRSFDSIRKFVNLIDKLTLKRKREVTIPIASELLNALEQGSKSVIEDTEDDEFNFLSKRGGIVG